MTSCRWQLADWMSIIKDKKNLGHFLPGIRIFHFPVPAERPVLEWLERHPRVRLLRIAGNTLGGSAGFEPLTHSLNYVSGKLHNKVVTLL